MIDTAAWVRMVVRALLGEPDRARPHEWRCGRKGSLVVYLHQGNWYDFETGIGGCVLDLVERERSCDRAAALAWLLARGYIPSRIEHDIEIAGLPRHGGHGDTRGDGGFSSALAAAIDEERVRNRP